MQYPLTLTFKILAFAPQISVVDAAGNLHFYIKQKLFKLKEAVTVFADVAQTRPLYTMSADRIIDFSARYNFADTANRPLGSLKRQGMKSIWKASYEIEGGDGTYIIREENPWVKVGDALFSEIPVLGILSGYVFNPAYLITSPGGSLVLRVKKQQAFFEGKYIIEQVQPLPAEEETRLLLSVFMMLLLERARG